MPDEHRLAVTLTIPELRKLLQETVAGFSASMVQVMKGVVEVRSCEVVAAPCPEPKEKEEPSGGLLINIKEVARLLSMGERTIWKMASCGRMPPPIRIGRACRWRRKDIELLIDTKAEKAEEERQCLAKKWQPRR